MLSHCETIRVRYGETDQMGFVYYGNYALYYEVGRVELLRKMGISYRDLERQGIGLPVVSFEISYLKPAKYDDLIIVETQIKELPRSKITFHYACKNLDGACLNTGKVALVFTNLINGKPIRCPKHIESILMPYLSE